MTVERVWARRHELLKQRIRRVIKLDRICVACGLKIKRQCNNMSPWFRHSWICSHMFAIRMRNIH